MNARMRLIASWIGAAMIGGAVVSAFGGATRPGPDEVRAKRLAIVDEAGKERIVLGYAEGVNAIRLVAADGEDQLTIIATEDLGSAVNLCDRRGTAKVVLDLLPEDEGALRFLDVRAKERLEMGLKETGSYLRLYDKGGKVKFRTP